jgi:hypothetical protein
VDFLSKARREMTDTFITTPIRYDQLFSLKNIQQVAKKIESCRRTWYYFLGNVVQQSG